ncbi:hypothetical protein IU448_25875 [Nocardia flavorosea]|uniref:hypothetical protein n=1 Tax=Nocardia flavorosea TaxID=53429 RepID=UPI0018949121|nr:hypothetical protein [Nocardia flavorosea]MBF6352412.1 hypothetical protein [Nocardia flavorosea]
MCDNRDRRYRTHYVCPPCRVSQKRWVPTAQHSASPPRCPRCSTEMLDAGHDFAAPRQHDSAGWSVVAAVLATGLRYDGYEPCGCGREPKPRPRTRAELRASHDEATRLHLTPAEALSIRHR